MKDNIVVSVLCIAYNHEKYIKKCLDSIVSQKTNFKFEVLIHDDASTDKTAAIITDYAKEYPELIIPILQKENKFSKGYKIIDNFLINRISGKYISFCECDDYWIDVNKLQLQVNALESHENCDFCSHITKRYNCDLEKFDVTVPNFEYQISEGILSREQQMEIAVCDLFHLSSWLIEVTAYKDFLSYKIDLRSLFYPTGDKAANIYFAEKTKIYFINKPMSVYRKGIPGSYTVRIEKNKKNFDLFTVNYFSALDQCIDFVSEDVKYIFRKSVLMYALTLVKSKKELLSVLDKYSYHSIKNVEAKLKIKVFIGKYAFFLYKIYYTLKNERDKTK